MDCHYVQHWNFVIRFVPQAVFVAQPVPQKNVQQVGFCRWILGCTRSATTGSDDIGYYQQQYGTCSPSTEYCYTEYSQATFEGKRCSACPNMGL